MQVHALRPIGDVAAEAGLEASELRVYGSDIAKVQLRALQGPARANGRVILVTSINPTPAGEGKTVTAIGLAQALRLLEHRTVVCLREPSMGPVFGLKGGATGGGRCTVEPADQINLHFTGDLHAVAAANNLLAAMIDEHIYRSREPWLDARGPTFHRVLDVNDRALRHTVTGLGGVLREAEFSITAASEVMAVLGLASNYADLRARLGRIVVGRTRRHAVVTAEDLRAAGAMAALLRDALQPNLVQTQEGGPALVHTGPFANIAHGTSSLVALLLAARLSEYTVIEAGFGADLGAEKFVHLVCSQGASLPDAAVVVASVRALKYHGGVSLAELANGDGNAVRRGLPQLHRHIGIVRRLGMRPVVCVNRFTTDRSEEVGAIRSAAEAWAVPCAVSEAFESGGEGAIALAEAVQESIARTPAPTVAPVYPPDAPLHEKIGLVAREIYGASDVTYAETARRQLEEIKGWGYGQLPVCIAKTQYSLTDDPALRGVPANIPIHVRSLEVRAGAGFVLALAGEITTMPALPPRPRAWEIDLDPSGIISGVA